MFLEVKRSVPAQLGNGWHVCMFWLDDVHSTTGNP